MGKVGYFMERSIVDFSKLSEDVLEEYDIRKYDSYEDVFEDVYMDDDAFSISDAVELLKDNSMQEVVEMQPYIYKCDGKYYRWPDAYLYEDELIEQYPFARVSENVNMSLTREQVEMYFKNQGRPDADESWYDEFLNAGERQPIYDEIVQNDYDLSDVDRWFHLMKVMGVEMKFETAMSINSALWEEDIETMELELPEPMSAKHKIYGFSEVASEGFEDATESRTKIYGSKSECINAAYECYCDAWKLFENEGIIENGCDENLDALLSKEEFSEAILKSGYVLIQLPDSHVQFEFFEQELELQKEVAIENKIKIDLGFASLIAEKGADPNYKEIFIGLEDSNGIWSQDIAVIGEKYHYEGDNVILDKGVSVKLYSDKDQEDYTHDFEIGIYEADEDLSEQSKPSLAATIEQASSLVENRDKKCQADDLTR